MTFSPPRQAITNITNALPAVVTTAAAHGLFTGNAVRIHVPPSFGMFQIGGKIYSVTVLSPTTFSLQYSQVPFVNVDSTNYSPFVTPSKPGFTAEVVPVGSSPTPLTNIPAQIVNMTADTPLSDALINNSTVEIPF